MVQIFLGYSDSEFSRSVARKVQPGLAGAGVSCPKASSRQLSGFVRLCDATQTPCIRLTILTNTQFCAVKTISEKIVLMQRINDFFLDCECIE